MSLDEQILKEFTDESKRLTANLLVILKEIEGDIKQVRRLEEFGNQVDRIMGGSKTLAMMVTGDHVLNIISDYTEVCKSVSYKAAQIQNQPQFFEICVALLKEASRTLQMLLEKINEPAAKIRQSMDSTCIERLRWVAHRFNVKSSSVSPDAMSQAAIDELMAKLGKN